MPDTNYTALAAECEKKAEQGEKPAYEWDKDNSWYHLKSSFIRLAISEDDEAGTEWAIRKEGSSNGHMSRIPGMPTIKGKVAAQLFAEALLRDATKPLHREAYEAFKECGVLKGELEDLKADIHHSVANAESVEDALRAELAAIKSKAVTIAVVDMPGDIGAAAQAEIIKMLKAAPAGRTFTEAEVVALMRVAWSDGFVSCDPTILLPFRIDKKTHERRESYITAAIAAATDAKGNGQ